MTVHDKILVLDFGSQYTQLIARRVRECGVYSEIISHDTPPEEIRRMKPKALILSGGPSSVYEEKAPLCSKEVLNLDIPVLGICYGMQLLSLFHGGSINASQKREYGRATLKLESEDVLFNGFNGSSIVWMSHGDKLDDLPDGFERIGSTDNSEFAAIRSREGAIYGLQFHPEVAHTEHGSRIIENFVRDISGCKGDWTPAAFIEDTKEEIRRRVGDKHVLCAVSGGVDSTVMAVLLSKALGERVTSVLIDTGLMRQNEAILIEEVFRRYSTLDLKIYARGERFLAALQGVIDPEEKRKAIGRVFIECFEEIAKELGDFEYLAQGTLYPDVIESSPVLGPSKTIKTHHNVGGLPEEFGFELVEPIRELFKDEVRRVGRELGLPEEMIGRHPFPGPGLAVRIIGEVTVEALEVLQRVDAIFIEELRSSGWYDRVWQAFVVLLPVKSVGVMGDNRTYAGVAALRAVNSVDGMTADWAKIPYEILSRTADRIISEVAEINRVVYDISSKPPSTIEWE